MSEFATTPLPFEVFAAEVAMQGVELDHDVREAGRLGCSSVIYAYNPTDTIAASTEAGRIIRREHQRGLVNQPIEPTPKIERDLAATSLAAILNATVEPVVADNSERQFTSNKTMGTSLCNEAEGYFAKSILRYDNPERPTAGSQIIVDRNQQPLLIRKSVGVGSGLSLVPLVVNGIPYPAGSIYEIRMLTFDADSAAYTRAQKETIAIVPHQKINLISFGRLSAFAFPPETRRSMFRAVFEIYPRGGVINRLLKTITLEDIRQKIATIPADQLTPLGD